MAAVSLLVMISRRCLMRGISLPPEIKYATAVKHHIVSKYCCFEITCGHDCRITNSARLPS